MADYPFKQIESKWQNQWASKGLFKVNEDPSKPKFYVLDMFPYPSGAGLHVGHPLGYIASDIVGRYKALKGYNVLHPMGFDSFGLPAEQYAVQTGQHPAITTEENINRYKEQLRSLGFNYDWSREVRTSDPSYYRWTQWIFGRLFEHWYDKTSNKARPISDLIKSFESKGSEGIIAACEEETPAITAADWKAKSEVEKEAYLQNYRLTYLSETMVNWCPALGTVLANEEVKDGLSERGGYPVERIRMKQWSMRITAYAERMLQGLEKIDWPEPTKEMQRNWIGKSIGAELLFEREDGLAPLKVFTTRVDTTFGVTYLSIAPEHELVPGLTTAEQKAEVEAYIEKAKNRSERDRMSDVKTVSGCFTGSHARNPFNGERIPIWIADYVLAGYGTGVVMAVPSSDVRDYAFAEHFHLPIINVQEGPHTDIAQEDFDPKAGTMVNSGFLNGKTVAEAIPAAIAYVEEKGFGKARVNFKMRDAIFGRQRYWGEPIPVKYGKDGLPQLLDEKELPLVLPQIDAYKPTPDGQPPLARNADFAAAGYELSTMPGWAGSSWYFLRYMDPENKTALVSKAAAEYWGAVDLYMGGAEHATGHLLYSRFWNAFLFDLGIVPQEEPFQKLVNQGMIQGRSSFVYRVSGTNQFVSYGLRKDYQTTPMHVEVSLVDNDQLDMEGFKAWRPDLADAAFITEGGKYICGSEVEKMSKSKYNVVNPDTIIAQYGADTLRMYEMFLGPLEQSKPWSTQGIEGVYKFLNRFWRLFEDDGNWKVNETEALPEELKVLHKTIKRVEEDIDRLSLNTPVSTFMIAVNELTQLKCHKQTILEPLVILLSPFAPHLAEELWEKLGHKESVMKAAFPVYNPEMVKEKEFEYPVSINGKVRGKIALPVDLPAAEVEQHVLALENVQKWLEGKAPKRIIVVPNKIVNVVI
jgi:leucyl-tRNA synthetase